MKILHTMLRVADLEKSIAFYTNVMGMKEIRRSVNEKYRYTLAFVGYDEDEAQLELTFNWDTNEYDLGTAYGHIALQFDDIYATCEQIKERGGNVTREPGPVAGGTTEIAFITDPDGYKVELIQTKK